MLDAVAALSAADLDELIEAYLQASADTRATNKPGGGKDAQG